MSSHSDKSRLDRLLAALEIAERSGNTFMAANIKTAIQEELRRRNSG
jgi:hypothetical protein